MSVLKHFTLPFNTRVHVSGTLGSVLKLSSLPLDSRVRVRVRVDAGGHLPGEVLRHLPAPSLQGLADALPRLQDHQFSVVTLPGVHGPHSCPLTAPARR